MKRLILAAAIAATLSTTAQAETVEKIGPWEFMTSVSELTGETSAMLALKSRPGPSDPLGRAGSAELFVGCANGQLVALVKWPAVLRPTYRYRSNSPNVDVAYRFDEGSVRYDQVSLSRTDFRSFGFWRGNDVGEFEGAGKYVIQVNSSEAVFDLTESATALGRLRQACSAA